MTEDELGQLLAGCPKLYHMAERGAWAGIKKHGLLSTSALLDLFGVQGADRKKIESERRLDIVKITDPIYGTASIRDQKPMDDAGLRRALPSHILPSDWYEFLNKKVFFWLSKDRFDRLTLARAYRGKKHEVLVLDSHKLVKAYFSKIWLSPINSGATIGAPQPRDYDTFARIKEYDYAKQRLRREKAVELCIDYSLPDVMNYLTKAYVVKDTKLIQDLE